MLLYKTNNNDKYKANTFITNPNIKWRGVLNTCFQCWGVLTTFWVCFDQMWPF